MKCPHCKQTLILPSHAEGHMEAYHQTLNAKTECCGKLVRVRPYLTYTVDLANPNLTEDDWGAIPNN